MTLAVGVTVAVAVAVLLVSVQLSAHSERFSCVRMRDITDFFFLQFYFTIEVSDHIGKTKVEIS